MSLGFDELFRRQPRGAIRGLPRGRGSRTGRIDVPREDAPHGQEPSAPVEKPPSRWPKLGRQPDLSGFRPLPLGSKCQWNNKMSPAARG